MSITDSKGRGKPIRHSFRLIVRDASYALTGLKISIIIAAAINSKIWAELKNYFFS